MKMTLTEIMMWWLNIKLLKSISAKFLPRINGFPTQWLGLVSIIPITGKVWNAGKQKKFNWKMSKST